MALALHDNQQILHIEEVERGEVVLELWSVECATREQESVQQGAFFFFLRMTNNSLWLHCCFVL